MGCVLAEPIVNGLETDLAGKLLVLRVDIHSQAGQTLADEYGSFATPTFIFFDAQGEEQWRQLGTLDDERVRAAVE